MFSIGSILPPLPRIKIVDVGAMRLKEGRVSFGSLLTAAPCEVIGFEPVSSEFEKLEREKNENEQFLPYFIGDGSTRTFHECNFAMTSSLFEPNTELLAKFQNLEELIRVVKTSEVKTTRLDDIPQLSGTDLLKLDIQGAELMALQGGTNMLNDVLVVQTEVEFVELYKGQPLFAEVDTFLRRQGFRILRMVLAGRTFKPLIVNGDVNAMMSQLLWADTVYVRDFMALDRLTSPALLKLACILHEAYRAFDLAALALEIHDRQAGTQLNSAYIARLTNPNA